jgi:hypothetical protein
LFFGRHDTILARIEGEPMLSLRNIVSILLVSFLFASAAFAQKRDTHFPTDDEVRLMLTQAERAVNEYKPLLDRWEKTLGKEGAEAVAKDRETLRGIDVGITGFRKNPQAFNGVLGFAFFEWLDDACRNALLSSLGASNTAAVELMDGDTEKARSNMELAKDFSNLSTVFYTVSENAGALYTRFVEDEEQLAKEAVGAATECGDILKKSKKSVSTP